jgi:hypothetical protein
MALVAAVPLLALALLIATGAGEYLLRLVFPGFPSYRTGRHPAWQRTWQDGPINPLAAVGETDEVRQLFRHVEEYAAAFPGERRSIIAKYREVWAAGGDRHIYSLEARQRAEELERAPPPPPPTRPPPGGLRPTPRPTRRATNPPGVPTAPPSGPPLSFIPTPTPTPAPTVRPPAPTSAPAVPVPAVPVVPPAPTVIL